MLSQLSRTHQVKHICAVGDGTIATIKLADDAVTSAKIVDDDC